jgi:hypothetical protein
VAIEAQEILALTLIFVVHVAGGVMLVWGMFGRDMGPRPRWWRRDDGPGDPPPPGPRPTPPSQHRRPLPLPGSWPSDVRLRDHTPLRDAHPRPPRRPSRSPQPARSPQRR